MKHYLSFAFIVAITLGGCVSHLPQTQDDAETTATNRSGATVESQADDGKSTNGVNSESPQLEPMESLILCQEDEQTASLIKQIRAEKGFKRFAKNTYRPTKPQQRLFGHEIRVIEFTTDSIKVYAAGNVPEFTYNIKRLLPDISCDGDTCQAPLANGQSLLLYKPSDARNKKIKLKSKAKRVRDTTILECTRPVKEKLPKGTA